MITFVLSSYLIGLALSCGSSNSKLGFHTRSTSNGQSNGEFWARIHTNGAWSDEWRRLDNLGCDDFEQGNDDYFNDFDAITTPFDAIALEACGTDGWAIDTIYAPGEHKASFCSADDGVSSTCYGGTQASGCAEYVWLDGDGNCPTMIVKLKETAGYDPGSPGNAPCGKGDTSCGSGQLGIHTKNTDNANSNAEIYGRLYSDGRWRGQWRKLDNENCDDFTKSYTDYFDDFDKLTKPWEALALYTCSDDGLAIDGIQMQTEYISSFCMKNCVADDSASCDGFTWLDGNGDCPRLVIKVDNSENYGDPGRPACGNGEYGANQPFKDLRYDNGINDNLLLFEQQQIASTQTLLNEMNFIFAGMAMLSVTIIVLVVIVLKRGKKNEYHDYNKVDVLSS